MRIPLDCLVSFETIPPKASFILSIEKYGQRDPIKVVRVGDQFLVADGRRRVAALKQLGETEVEAIIINDLDAPIVTILGNLQRDRNPLAEAEAFRELLDGGWNQDDLSGNLGISKSKIYWRLKLFDILPELKEKIIRGEMGIVAGEIASKLSRDEQEKLAQNEKVTIAAAQSARRSEQLILLDLDSITIPKTSELDRLLEALTRLCVKIQGRPEREILVEAVKALESLRGLDYQ